MNINYFKIYNIPAALWGEVSENVIIAVHGNMSNKTDAPIRIMAENAAANGYQVLSFDLAEHGGRKHEGALCKVQNCVEDLKTVYNYAKLRYKNISVFGVSMGAYFSLLAYSGRNISRAWFLSPVTDMKHVIENMMGLFNITKERLKENGEMETPIGQILYWDYYCYVLSNPVEKWDVCTYILCGGNDEICGVELIKEFADAFGCRLDIINEAGHYFHSEKELECVDLWLKETM